MLKCYGGCQKVHGQLPILKTENSEMDSTAWMAQSVEHMQGMLKRSPMVQALAQHKPEVKQILNDPKKLQEEMALVQRNLAALQNAEQAMRNPHKRQQVMRWADA